MNTGGASGIIQLRRLLTERFPRARTWAENAPPKTQSFLPTGLPQLDALLQGGWLKGAITEVASHGPGTGSALLLRALLRQTHRAGRWMGLIDGRDSFDLAGLEAPVLSRLFWVRCQTAEEALKAADFLLRDRNFPLIALDLKMNPAAQLRKIPGTTWYRLQRIARQNATTLVALTPRAMIAGAETRLTLESRFTLSAWPQSEEELVNQLEFDLARSAEAAQAAG
jgi:hypothetical protein